MKMMSRQSKREDDYKEIFDLINKGIADEEICKICNCNIEKIKCVRQRYGLVKRTVDMNYSRIEDYKEEQKKSVAVPVVIGGKTYMDVTGDLIDCGSVYR